MKRLSEMVQNRQQDEANTPKLSRKPTQTKKSLRERPINGSDLSKFLHLHPYKVKKFKLFQHRNISLI